MNAFLICALFTGDPWLTGSYRHFAWQDKSGPVYDWEIEFTNTRVGEFYLAWFRDMRGEGESLVSLYSRSPTNPDSLVLVSVRAGWDTGSPEVETYIFYGALTGGNLKGILTGTFIPEPREMLFERF